MLQWYCNQIRYKTGIKDFSCCSCTVINYNTRLASRTSHVAVTGIQIQCRHQGILRLQLYCNQLQYSTAWIVVVVVVLCLLDPRQKSRHGFVLAGCWTLLETWICACWALANNGEIDMLWLDVGQQWKHGCDLAQSWPAMATLVCCAWMLAENGDTAVQQWLHWYVVVGCWPAMESWACHCWKLLLWFLMYKKTMLISHTFFVVTQCHSQQSMSRKMWERTSFWNSQNWQFRQTSDEYDVFVACIGG